MLDTLKQVASTLAQVAIEENNELERMCQQGIFFMPELAYAYACGKAIMNDAQRFSGNSTLTWQREIDLGLGSPSDLVLELPSNYRIVVEFKMRDTLSSYRSDIEKLRRLDSSKNARIFCALVDVFASQQCDQRVAQLENTEKDLIPLMRPFLQFPTMQSWYKKPISCLVAVWSVGNPPVDLP